MNLTHHLKQHRAEVEQVNAALDAPTRQYVLLIQEEGSVCRINTASHTPAGREALQEQADRHPCLAWVQSEDCI